MVEVKTPQITKIADRLGKIYKEHYLFYKKMDILILKRNHIYK